MTDDERGIDAIIRAAMQRGEFENLPGEGKPLDLSAYFEAPEDLRMAYSILRNADVLPEEAELLKEIAALKGKLQDCTDPALEKRLRQAIQERLLKFNVMVDSIRARRTKRP